MRKDRMEIERVGLMIGERYFPYYCFILNGCNAVKYPRCRCFRPTWLSPWISPVHGGGSFSWQLHCRCGFGRCSRIRIRSTKCSIFCILELPLVLNSIHPFQWPLRLWNQSKNELSFINHLLDLFINRNWKKFSESEADCCFNLSL